MKTLITLLGTIGLAFTNANNFLNINNSPKEVKEITYEFSENKKDIVHSYKTSSVSNPAYESWDFVVSTGLKSFQKPKSIRILEWFLNNGSDKIDWGSDHYDVFSVPLKIMGKEINKINEGKITDEEVAYNRMNFSFKESYQDFLATAEVVRGITTALFFDNLDWHIQFLFPAKLTFDMSFSNVYLTRSLGYGLKFAIDY
ncbi:MULTISPECIES: hypothetical protein [unclassified Spiroplasma]|uniref:hypothetical protein n=1 Tax=unclassified Spiroplasma TaxID=2637901 RepID=UPI0030CBAC26